MTRRTPRSIHAPLLAVIAACTLGVATPSMARAQDPADLQLDAMAAAGTKGSSGGARGDDRRHPLGDKQRALRQKALQQKIKGVATGKVHQVARGQYVELAREGEDPIWTVLGEFGTAGSPTPSCSRWCPGPAAQRDPGSQTAPSTTPRSGPRTSTRRTYENLLFSEAPGAVSMRNFYIEQSSNRYTVNGEVTDWVQVPYNEAALRPQLLRRHRLRPDLASSSTIRSTPGTPRSSPPARPPPNIDAYLAQFDVWDRYDHDGDGNFDEPDGYIDHFQSVHAGEGEETGGGAQGADAIWSHRWYVQLTPIGANGPTLDDGTWCRWAARESAGRTTGSVTTPSSRRTAASACSPTSSATTSACPTCTTRVNPVAENSTGVLDADVDGLVRQRRHRTTSAPSRSTWARGRSSSWDGSTTRWPSPARSRPTRSGRRRPTRSRRRALFVVLPDKQVTVNLGPTPLGDEVLLLGERRRPRRRHVPPVHAAGGCRTDGAGPVRHRGGLGLRLPRGLDGWGTTWQNVPTNLSTATNPNGQNFGNGITGSSAGLWVTLDANLAAYAGNVLLGFRYWTDGAVAERGFMVDDIQISGQPVDGAETDAGWTFTPAGGFRVTSGVESTPYFNSYVTEFRQYRGYDDSLRTGAVQLRLPRQPGAGQLGRALPVSGRPAHQLLGWVAGRQRHDPASGLRAHPAHRRAS